jgi:hypothetical protein
MGPRLCNFKGIQFFLIWLLIPIFGHSAFAYSFIQRILRTRKEKMLLPISSVRIQTPPPPPPVWVLSISMVSFNKFSVYAKYHSGYLARVPKNQSKYSAFQFSYSTAFQGQYVKIYSVNY